MSGIVIKKRFYTMKTIINEVKRLNNDINNIITELVKARLAHNDVAVANVHHKMESLMVETQQVCSFIIDNLDEDPAISLEETIGTSPHSRETIVSYLQQSAQL